MSKMVREQWLNEAVTLLARNHFKPQSLKVPEKLRVSVGFPRGSKAKASSAIGQCWTPEASGDKHAEIFISPVLGDPARVMDVLVHELVHATVGNQEGHGKVFKKAAISVGLEGKMTATVASSALTEQIKGYLKLLPKFPHAELSPLDGLIGSGPKKQGTRLLKCSCPDCGYTFRVTMKWVETGLPVCHCGGMFECPDAGQDPGEGDDE